MMDKAIYNRVASLEQHASDMLKEFAYLTHAKDIVRHRNARIFDALEVKQLNPYTIEATYLNTTVRFQLYLNFKDNYVNGRVVCLNQYAVCDEPNFDVLGQFNFDQSGRTDMGADEKGNIRIMAGHADEIVVAWLNKAIEQGPQVFAQAKI